LFDAQSTAITATQGSIAGATGTFTVVGGPTATFSVPTPAQQTAGTAFNLSITGLDQWSNQSGDNGSKTISFSGPSNAPNGQVPTYPPSVSFTNGAGTASITLFDAQNTTITATQGSVTGTSGSFTVGPGAANNFVVSTPGQQTSGTAFTISLTARDAWNNTATGYAGSKSVTFSGPGSAPDLTAPTYPASVTFSSGASSPLPSITLFKAESPTITATQGGVSGVSGAFTVVPGAAAKLAWTHVTTTSSATPTPPCLFTCTYASSFGGNKSWTANVSVTDAHGNTVSNLGSGHTATVTLTGGSSPGTLTPASPATLNFPASGVADSTTTITYKSSTGSSSSTDSLTATSSGFTNATASFTK
jgi:hypothetical protein